MIDPRNRGMEARIAPDRDPDAIIGAGLSRDAYPPDVALERDVERDHFVSGLASTVLVTLFTARDVTGNASRVPGLDLGYTDMPDAVGLANDWGAPLTVNEATRILNVSEGELRAEAARVGVDLADDGAGTETDR